MKHHEFRLMSVFSLTSNTPFVLFKEMWMAVFMWCFVSSVFLYSIAAVIAFIILRKHKFGRFYGLMIIIMGTIIPCSLGVLSSAAVAFVYKHSSFTMVPTHAMMWGVGQTVIHAAVGFTRILATLWSDLRALLNSIVNKIYCFYIWLSVGIGGASLQMFSRLFFIRKPSLYHKKSGLFRCRSTWLFLKI